jgi:hypothetical protein
MSHTSPATSRDFRHIAGYNAVRAAKLLVGKPGLTPAQKTDRLMHAAQHLAVAADAAAKSLELYQAEHPTAPTATEVLDVFAGIEQLLAENGSPGFPVDIDDAAPEDEGK